MANLAKILLFPLSLLYGGIMQLRNTFYLKGKIRRVSFDIPVVVLGNLRAGGTGKTPHTLALVERLKTEYKVAVLSRGYGRKTKGFYWVATDSQAETVGDEPLLMKKYYPEVPVAVCEDRVKGIMEIRAQKPETEVVVLDDAFQHLRLQAGHYILLTEWSKPFYKDWVLPAGRLREFRKGAGRAQQVVVTKCPESIGEMGKERVQTRIKKYVKNVPIHFTTYQFGSWVAAQGKKEELKKGEKVVLVSGIANPQQLQAMVSEHFQVVQHFSYPDHANYTEAQLKQWHQLNFPIITTEKDAVKLAQIKFPEKLQLWVIKLQVGGDKGWIENVVEYIESQKDRFGELR